MVPIIICEDNLPYQKKLREEIEKYIMISQYDFGISLVTGDPNKVLQEVKTISQRGIYFLDVDLQHDTLDGFKLGKEIRKYDSRGFIIYVTTHEELAFETFRYRVEAMDYIIKDDEFSFIGRLHSCLDSIVELIQAETNDSRSYYTVKVFDEVHHLPVEDIFLFETSSQKHRLIVHTNKQSLEFFGSLTEIETELGDTFFRVHRSFLVNKEQIQSLHLKENQLTLNNGYICEVSRSKKKQVRSILKQSDQLINSMKKEQLYEL